MSTLTAREQARFDALAKKGGFKVVAKTETRKPAKKVTKAAKVTKGSQTRETLSRKDWNRTLTAKARLAGGDTYKRTLAQWADVQAARTAGYTPDEVLASI